MSDVEWESEEADLFLWGQVEGRYVVEVENDGEYVMKIYDNQRGMFMVDRIEFDFDDPDEDDVADMERIALASIAAYEEDDNEVDVSSLELDDFWDIEIDD